MPEIRTSRLKYPLNLFNVIHLQPQSCVKKKTMLIGVEYFYFASRIYLSFKLEYFILVSQLHNVLQKGSLFKFKKLTRSAMTAYVTFNVF